MIAVGLVMSVAYRSKNKIYILQLPKKYKQKGDFMYRYDTFHDELMLELINNVHDGSVHQAYIFEGRRDKHFESAKLFAAALTCRNKSIAPCGSCPVCSLSYAGTNPDISFINTGDKKASVWK